MKNLIEYIISESNINNPEVFRTKNKFLKRFSLNKNDNVTMFRSPEEKKLKDFFNSTENASNIPHAVTKTYNNELEIIVKLINTRGAFLCQIVKYEDSSDKPYYAVLGDKLDNLVCNRKSQNKFFDMKEIPNGELIDDTNFKFTRQEKVYYIYYFKTLNSIFKQFVNRAIEVATSDNKNEQKLMYYVKSEYLPDEFKQENIQRTAWNNLLKKYNIDANSDVIVIVKNKSDRTVNKKENWGPLTPELFKKFDRLNNRSRYTDTYYEFEEKNYKQCELEFYKTLSNTETFGLYYGNGLVD